MSDLLGAISLTGQPVSDHMSPAIRQKMLGFLPTYPTATLEFEQGPIWVCAPSARFARDATRCIAAEGWIAPGGADGAKNLRTALRNLRRGSDSVPDVDGHYVLVVADSDSGSITLTRAISGGERLYYTRVGDLLLFASSVNPLLAHPLVKRRLNHAVTNEVFLTGMVNFGYGTLFEGIDEVLVGHSLTVDREIHRQEWAFRGALRSPSEPIDVAAKSFREKLANSVSKSIGNDSRIAVALSGGIDSSAVIAAAVECVGADNVHAFTWEFNDPNHETETHFATEVASKLGVKHHHVFKLHSEEFKARIPEVIWRSESLTHWPKPFLMSAAEEIREFGFDRYISGFGIGSHMGYFADFASALRLMPSRDRFLRYWKRSRFDGSRRFRFLNRLHPGLGLPHPRLYYSMLMLLKNRGYISDVADFYPSEIAPFLTQTSDQIPDPGGEGILEDLQLHSFAHLMSCIDVTRSEKSTREATGIRRLSPAHVPECLPYAYFPLAPQPRLWSKDRDLRPGKLLLQKAYSGMVPDSVLYRVKSWSHAVASRSWLRDARLSMLQALPDFPQNLEDLGSDYARAIRYWEPRSINATGLVLSLWSRMFIEMPLRKTPPTWEDLGVGATSAGPQDSASGLEVVKA